MPRISGNEAKKVLKEAGIDTSKVSIRNSRGSALDVTIKDLEIDIDQVRSLLEKFEHIYRCETTGEILSGGNYFVFVSYAWDGIPVPRDLMESYMYALAVNPVEIERQTQAFSYWTKRRMHEQVPSRSEGQVSAAFHLCERVVGLAS